jgi:hypothetical protein
MVNAASEVPKSKKAPAVAGGALVKFDLGCYLAIAQSNATATPQWGSW